MPKPELLHPIEQTLLHLRVTDDLEELPAATLVPPAKLYDQASIQKIFSQYKTIGSSCLTVKITHYCYYRNRELVDTLPLTKTLTPYVRFWLEVPEVGLVRRITFDAFQGKVVCVEPPPAFESFPLLVIASVFSNRLQGSATSPWLKEQLRTQLVESQRVHQE